ncbi:MAG: MFS transporter [Gammaproteobacteria bacterium]|nr:MFS transporter [Gammaproteobacteria bacterium]
MQYRKLDVAFLNIGHFLDHFFLLIFASAAALVLTQEWSISYSQLIPYATASFIAFGACTIPAGWLADKWSRENMMVIFFIGIGASALLASLSNTPLQMGICLTLVGVFASIYHPVGLAMLVQGRAKTGMPIAINGVFGNMGVASAALITAFFIDSIGWRSAFIIPGIISLLIGVTYLWITRKAQREAQNGESIQKKSTTSSSDTATVLDKKTWIWVFSIVCFTTAMGGLIFQSTTFALPKILDDKLAGIAGSATDIGWYSFIVFSVAAFAQLVVGYLLDKHSIRTIFMVIALLQAIFLGVMTQLSGLWTVLGAVVFMLAVFGQIPINDVLVGRISRNEWRSRAYAARYIITFSVMAFTIPLIAWIYGTWGSDTLFILLSMVALIIFSAILLLPKKPLSAQTSTSN